MPPPKRLTHKQRREATAHLRTVRRSQVELAAVIEEMGWSDPQTEIGRFFTERMAHAASLERQLATMLGTP